jgi:hypothetical protein
MSSAPTDCRVPDPTDAKADGNFGNHRAGYGDRLDRIIATARKGWTLAAGEGLVLVQEIDRLRKALDEHDTARMTAELLLERERRTSDSHFGMSVMYEKEYERARDILAALRNPSDLMVDALREQIYNLSCFDEALKAIRVAVAAAEQEVSA